MPAIWGVISAAEAGIGTVNITTFIIAAVIKIALVVFIMLTGRGVHTVLERKLVGRIQNRWGPTAWSIRTASAAG